MGDDDEASVGVPSGSTPSNTMSTVRTRGEPSSLRRQPTSSDKEMEAGPSRVRRSSTEHNQDRPTSPDEALSSRQPTPSRPSTPHLDLTTYPTPTLLRLLASLLQQIATANDQLRPEVEDDGEEHLHDDGSSGSRSASRQGSHPHPSPTTALFNTDSHPPPPILEMTDPEHPLFTASRTSLAHPSSLLSFHARHVPSISIEAYLLRILKYCPTTNEVFLALLVYFDRMSRLGTAQGVGGIATGARGGLGRGFAIDSYNVHRLVIAGVTVASKFFSDVFYTNSRYAKVGGLPPHELNQLELQFLLLNDFRLVIPSQEMQRYGDRLLGYWEGREADAAEIVQVMEARVETKVDRGRSTRRSTDNSAGENVTAESAPERPMQLEEPETEAMEVDARPPASEQEPLTPIAPSTTRQPSAPDPPPQAPPPSAPSAAQPASLPRSKERGPVRQSTLTFAEPQPTSSVGLAHGLRDWVRGDEVMGVMGNRMTSPMRD